MPPLSIFLTIISIGLGFLGGLWAAGIKYGRMAQRVDELEECSRDVAHTLSGLDARLRSVENATATLPSMAVDIQAIRAQLWDLTAALRRGN
jgi:hypothetical protein